MATSSLYKFVDYYIGVFQNHSDIRTKEWLTISSIWIPVTIIVIYLWICKYLGPSIMQNRTPVEIGQFATYYNLFLLSFNGALAIFFLYYQIMLQYSPVCQIISTEGDQELMLAKGFYAFYISKIFELNDSVLMILKKKFEQLTVLHRYHHSSMLIIVWLGVRFAPGGSSIVLATINTFAHFIIYAYYCIFLLQFRAVSRLTFRNVTTFSQLIQFGLVILHCTTAFFSNCGYPRSALVWLTIYVSSFFGLFIWYISYNILCSGMCTKSPSDHNDLSNKNSRHNPAIEKAATSTGNVTSPGLLQQLSQSNSSDASSDDSPIVMQDDYNGVKHSSQEVDPFYRSKDDARFLARKNRQFQVDSGVKQSLQNVVRNRSTDSKAISLRRTAPHRNLHQEFVTASMRNEYQSNMTVIGSLMKIKRNLKSKQTLDC